MLPSKEIEAWQKVAVVVLFISFIAIITAVFDHYGMTWPEAHPERFGL